MQQPEPITLTASTVQFSSVLHKSYEFAPKDDMTPVEAAWIGLMSGRVAYNTEAHIKQHGLERHFTERE